MLPPINQVVLSANPRFDALYRDLCTNKLNPDGTSKLDAKAQHDREAFREEIRKARVEASKKELIRCGLRELSYKADGLPDEVGKHWSRASNTFPNEKQLQELVAIVAAVLEGNIAEEDGDLLQNDLAKFKDNIKPITAAIAKQFRQDADLLATTLIPDSSIPVQSLAGSVDQLKTSIATSRSALTESRFSLAQEVSTLHAIYRQIIETSIRILEQTMHGSVARGVKAKADYLALVAEGMSKKLSVQHGHLLSQLYSTDVQEVLRAKSEGVERDVRSTKGKVREAEQKLEAYRRAVGMLGLAEEYAEILKETAKVKAEILRLEGRVG